MGATTGIKAMGYGWSCDMDFDFTTSVFDSRFLEFEYRSFLDRISHVPGMAAHVKATKDPFAFVFEWDGAVNDAQFVDDAGRNISIAPAAWTVALAYRFDWNPLVTQIGSQGSYLDSATSDSSPLLNDEGPMTNDE